MSVLGKSLFFFSRHEQVSLTWKYSGSFRLEKSNESILCKKDVIFQPQLRERIRNFFLKKRRDQNKNVKKIFQARNNNLWPADIELSRIFVQKSISIILMHRLTGLIIRIPDLQWNDSFGFVKRRTTFESKRKDFIMKTCKLTDSLWFGF